MKTLHAIKLPLAAVLAAGILVSATADAGEHRARSVNSTVTRTGPYGKTMSRQSALSTSGQGSFNAHSTVTGPNGKTATREQSGAYDPETKTFTRQGTATGPNGNQSSFNTSVQKTENGYVRTGTRTGPNGNTTTTTGQGTYDPATGTFQQSRTTTGPNGKSVSESRTVTASPSTSETSTSETP